MQSVEGHFERFLPGPTTVGCVLPAPGMTEAAAEAAEARAPTTPPLLPSAAGSIGADVHTKQCARPSNRAGCPAGGLIGCVGWV